MYIFRAATAVFVVLFALSPHAQERHPFHIATFSDNRTISLAIMMLEASADQQYDYDVEVELTEHNAAGQATYTDSDHHLVRVRCLAPAVVKVGGALHNLPIGRAPSDWKEDLWNTLCLKPFS